MNVPEAKLPEVLSLLPGMKSPTVLPLAESGWVSVHTVIEQKRFWLMIEKLKNAGAEGILVSSIEKMFL
jgi:ATP phosphoribosyltransferase